MIAPGGNPELSTYEAALGLPEGFATRPRPASSDSAERVLELRREQQRRGYLLGVLIAYIVMAEDLLAQIKQGSLDNVLIKYPPEETDSQGRNRNTMSINGPDHLLSLRGYYNFVEHVIRHDLLRYTYPNSAPHATQSWTQHKEEFKLICAMSPDERTLLADALWDEVLRLPEMAGQDGVDREVRPFETILMEFPPARGDPGGALLQGLAFAYYRADSPNVTLRAYKVGSGSSRVGAAGDVDGWVGDQLSLSVEVKDMDICYDDLSQFDQFVKHLSRWPNCTAVALARSFDADSEEWLRDHNILCFDRDRMASNVEYWDVPKQRLAAREFLHYVGVVQQNHKMRDRFKSFCAEKEIDLT